MIGEIFISDTPPKTPGGYWRQFKHHSNEYEWRLTDVNLYSLGGGSPERLGFFNHNHNMEYIDDVGDHYNWSQEIPTPVPRRELDGLIVSLDDGVRVVAETVFSH